MGVNDAKELKDSMDNEVVGYKENTYDNKSSEKIENNKMFEGINKILDEIYTEHKQNGKVLETNIEESKDLRTKIQKMKNVGGPAVISEQMKYLWNSEELVITKQDKKISLYVNITKDDDNHEVIDKDGHKIHIHIPHQVLVEMAETGDNHVIHIDSGLNANLRYKIKNEMENDIRTKNIENAKTRDQRYNM